MTETGIPTGYAVFTLIVLCVASVAIVQLFINYWRRKHPQPKYEDPPKWDEVKVMLGDREIKSISSVEYLDETDLARISEFFDGVTRSNIDARFMGLAEATKNSISGILNQYGPGYSVILEADNVTAYIAYNGNIIGGVVPDGPTREYKYENDNQPFTYHDPRNRTKSTIQTELNTAIAEENYEEAAKLRDELKDMT